MIDHTAQTEWSGPDILTATVASQWDLADCAASEEQQVVEALAVQVSEQGRASRIRGCIGAVLVKPPCLSSCSLVVLAAGLCQGAAAAAGTSCTVQEVSLSCQASRAAG